ncbi:hypothetical protein [Agromyces seonyuensis]|uniref:Uncharacterized protein n=1 Tax=Agromyces seonyuensis TaxID=2662446 RepID=A0A6I4P100_9MICO|nr:hypothetical protein [Agromyces seonyuensis]MWB98405.1 hypothetical protein [Agromyces seonyuensis]
MLTGEDDGDEFEDEPAEPTGPVRAAGAPVAAPVAPAPARAEPRTITPVTTTVSTGHWADGLAVDDSESPQPFDQLLARGGLSGVPTTTTSALILPALPDGGPLTTPHPLTGEIIVTGSIDLPRSFGATGAHPDQVDSSDIDRLFDQVEDSPATGVAPVAAKRAVSTQGSTRDYITAPKKEGASMPLILAITAGVLALGVVAALVVGVVAGLI